MTDTRKVMQQALEALELHAKQYPHMQKGYTVDAIEALRSALAQQGEPQPVLWVNPNLDRVTTDSKLAEKNGLYIPLYARPTCKQDLQVPTVKKSLHVATGWAAPKDQYAVPVLFNPYSGEPRDVRDVQSDPQGVLIVPPGKVEMLASKGRSCKVGSGCVAGESSQCACSELNPPAAPAAQPDTWTGDGWTWLQALVFLVLISPFLFLIFWSTK